MNSGVDESKIPGCEGGRRKLFTYKPKYVNLLITIINTSQILLESIGKIQGCM